MYYMGANKSSAKIWSFYFPVLRCFQRTRAPTTEGAAMAGSGACASFVGKKCGLNYAEKVKIGALFVTVLHIIVIYYSYTVCRNRSHVWICHCSSYTRLGTF